MFRFDNYSRDEKLFSATILPYLFLYKDFEGLKCFLKMLNKKITALNIPLINLENFSKEIKTIQIIPEANIDRDLSYYKIDIPSVCVKKVVPQFDLFFYSKKQTRFCPNF